MAKVLITGASTGFGKLMVESLLKNNHSVVASMRVPTGRNKDKAQVLENLGAKIVELDVTNEESVNKAVNTTLTSLGSIDAVINNAGVGVSGAQECFTTQDWQKLFDVNVFGVQRVNRAVLPHLRQQKSGLLIHVSSLLGRMVLPFMGPYNASKYALEALAENYRVELSSFGIESVIIEPGGFGTNFFGNISNPSDTTRVKDYETLNNIQTEMMSSFEKNLTAENGPNPQWVADAAVKLVELPLGKRPFRTVVDGLGMGQPIENLNKQSEDVNKTIYGNFGLDKLLQVAG